MRGSGVQVTLAAPFFSNNNIYLGERCEWSRGHSFRVPALCPHRMVRSVSLTGVVFLDACGPEGFESGTKKLDLDLFRLGAPASEMGPLPNCHLSRPEFSALPQLGGLTLQA